MYHRLLKPPRGKSFFLFGPRGTGKTSWVKENFKDALYLDLLDTGLYVDLLARPKRLEELIPQNFKNWVVIDEVQKIPELLNEVHRLIEKKKLHFVLTGSSARTLRRKGVNLLAGRALKYAMHPLTAVELGEDFDLAKALHFGLLPSIQTESDPKRYLETYVATYLREEILQEGITRNLSSFARFLETASFSQGSLLNMSEIARECALERKTVEGYFEILEDLLLGVRLPPFAKRAKRRTVSHAKFYFFDAGVYRTLRPRGPLDSSQEMMGASFETLFFQNARALNDYLSYDYRMFYWRTASGLEVDFVFYGEKGLVAFEIKSSTHIHSSDLKGLLAFREEFRMARCFAIYQGDREFTLDNITILPMQKALKMLPEILTTGKSGA